MFQQVPTDIQSIGLQCCKGFQLQLSSIVNNTAMTAPFLFYLCQQRERPEKTGAIKRAEGKTRAEPCRSQLATTTGTRKFPWRRRRRRIALPLLGICDSETVSRTRMETQISLLRSWPCPGLCLCLWWLYHHADLTSPTSHGQKKNAWPWPRPKFNNNTRLAKKTPVDNNVSTFLAAAAALVCRRRRCLQIRTSESLGFFKLFFVFTKPSSCQN
jgi:hypothetical protein